MAQGKAFTPEQRENIIQSLQRYLEMGFSRNKACAFIGLAPGTLSNWVKDDESLGMKLASWENTNSALALSNIYSALQKESEEGKADISKWYLERREEGYKPKQDITSDDKALPAPIISLDAILGNNSASQDSEAQ